MGIFDPNEDDVILENADLDCEPQGDSVTKAGVVKIDEYLDPGEKVHYLATGTSLTIDGEDQGIFKIRVAVTDRRIVWKNKTGLVSTEETSFDYGSLSSVNFKSGIISKKLRLESSSQTYEISVTSLQDKSEAKGMVQFIRDRMSAPKKSDSPRESSNDPIDQLERLRDLKDDGVVTEEEFEEKKRELLDQI